MEYTLDTTFAGAAWARLDAFARAYVEAMMWLLQDEDGNNLDYLGVHDIADETLACIAATCAAFQQENADALQGADLAQAGHDFYLTRNGHGAGYWDRPADTYPRDPRGERLTRAADAYGETYAYVDDAGQVIER